MFRVRTLPILHCYPLIGQLVEHSTVDRMVPGSIPGEWMSLPTSQISGNLLLHILAWPLTWAGYSQKHVYISIRYFVALVYFRRGCCGDPVWESHHHTTLCSRRLWFWSDTILFPKTVFFFFLERTLGRNEIIKSSMHTPKICYLYRAPFSFWVSVMAERRFSSTKTTLSMNEHDNTAQFYWNLLNGSFASTLGHKKEEMNNRAGFSLLYQRMHPKR